MGNQQEMLTQAELGWIAGIIEGEGSITMNVRRKKWKGWNGIGVDLQVYIVNTDGGIIRKAVEIFKKMDIESRLCEKQTNPILRRDGNGFYQNKTKTMLIVNVNRMKDILKIITNIQPFLVGEKKDRAFLIAQFIKRRLIRQTTRSKGGATWYDGYDWKIVEKFYKITGGKLLPEVKQFLREHTPNVLKNDDMFRTA